VKLKGTLRVVSAIAAVAVKAAIEADARTKLRKLNRIVVSSCLRN
jgi:hypothetical protein